MQKTASIFFSVDRSYFLKAHFSYYLYDMIPKTCPEFVFATKNILGGVVQNFKSGSFISVSRCCLEIGNEKIIWP